MTYQENYNLIDWNAREITLERKQRSAPARSSLPMPLIISDSMPAAEHVDGKFYESKSAFRRVTKARGLIEVGNDPARHRKPAKPDRDKAIDASIERAFARAKA
jgi:hypothetical protein